MISVSIALASVLSMLPCNTPFILSVVCTCIHTCLSMHVTMLPPPRFLYSPWIMHFSEVSSDPMSQFPWNDVPVVLGVISNYCLLFFSKCAGWTSSITSFPHSMLFPPSVTYSNGGLCACEVSAYHWTIPLIPHALVSQSLNHKVFTIKITASVLYGSLISFLLLGIFHSYDPGYESSHMAGGCLLLGCVFFFVGTLTHWFVLALWWSHEGWITTFDPQQVLYALSVGIGFHLLWRKSLLE